VKGEFYSDMFQRLRREFFPEPDAFDRRLGVQTAAISSLFWKRLGHRKDFVRYQAVDESWFLEAIKDVPRWPFIDMGSGKGRALILAHEAGFTDLTGVDFSPKLCRIACRNLEKVGIRASVICQDAGEFQFPRHPAVVFFYNPFGRDLMQRVLANAGSESRIFVYVNPLHESVFQPFKLLRRGEMFALFRTHDYATGA
jgi:hypothetical protein